MYSVQFTDFRCFGHTDAVEIRPITLLVGENSTGKTSFLAGLRFVLESFSLQSRNPFNRDPYYLGGFDQIAHFKGGRGGRAKSFSMSIRTPAPSNGRGRSAPVRDGATHRFSFMKGAPQPELQLYQFAADDTEVELALEDEKAVNLNVFRPPAANDPITVPLRISPPASMLRESTSFIPYLISELNFPIERGDLQRNRGQGTEVASPQPEDQSFRALVATFRDSARTLSQDVFASAPVRTQPLRTYTPSELLASSEGSHVPLELSRAKARDPERWAEIRQGLIAFGKNSGLFSDIDIRQLGKGDIDPFQIMVKINGPAMNLADVGYGISQVLPIVYQVQHSSRHGTFLLQQPEVHLHPRVQAELGSLLVSMVAGKVGKPTFVVETHSDYLIDRVRIEVARGKISPGDVTILFFQRGPHGSTIDNLFLSDQGEIKNAPEEFRSFFIEEHGKLLGL
jgi:hypothetical protein